MHTRRLNIADAVANDRLQRSTRQKVGAQCGEDIGDQHHQNYDTWTQVLSPSIVLARKGGNITVLVRVGCALLCHDFVVEALMGAQCPHCRCS